MIVRNGVRLYDLLRIYDAHVLYLAQTADMRHIRAATDADGTNLAQYDYTPNLPSYLSNDMNLWLTCKRCPANN